MILLATFVSISTSSTLPVSVPSIEVTHLKVPYQTESGTALSSYSSVKTRKLCEAMGREYVNSISATLPSGTTVTMSCVGESKADYEDISAS